MNCPKYNTTMEAISFAGIEVGRCTACATIWSDAGEFADMKQLTVAEWLKSLLPR